MNEIISQPLTADRRPQTLTPPALPAPRVAFTIRAGVSADLSFIDALQKAHRKQVGWMPMVQLEGKIAAGHVLIAEADEPIGYVIGNDRYFKRDDCGVIYQMNVVPGTRRRLVGATLLQALFERSAYGCRLYCCWCAQDIEANRFWEACGFVPLAFRAGSEKKSRVHIFWQKRIRAGDVTTPWWYPTETSGGSIRENRVVLPIPLAIGNRGTGTHWSDAKPLVLPGIPQVAADDAIEPRRLPAAKKTPPTAEPKRVPIASTQALGLRFGNASPVEAPALAAPKAERASSLKPPGKPRRRNDPELVAKARELRDRWLEQVNAQGMAPPAGKYDVVRSLPQQTGAEVKRIAA